MIRLAPTMPVYCAACFNQQPELRHVDLDAACDRGYGNEEAIRVVMDDLIICENCARETGEAIGMTDDAQLKADLADARHKLSEAEKEREKAQEYADRLEGLFDHRPEPIQIDHRRKPRVRT